MRFIQVFIIIFLIISCSSNKPVTIKPKNNIVTDSVIESNTSIPKSSEIIEISESIDTITSSTISEIIIPQPKDTITSKTVIRKDVFNHMAWTTLLQKHVSKEGNVNYKGFKSDRKALQKYIASLGANMPNDTWTKEDKLAYWINAYNALTIDLILRHYPLKSIKDIKKPWDQRYWKLGNKWYSLNEIEHDILRKMKEPRIHFAIVCASYSCPKLQNEAYEASRLEEQLTNAAKTFINDPEKNTITPDKIALSKIFAWFDKDFLINGTNSIIDYVNRYSDVKIASKTPKKFKAYNWSLNE